MVAVLFARADSCYKKIPDCDVWDLNRDARNWPGGEPVIAHPPCRVAGLPAPGKGKDVHGGWTLGISQSWWGHRAEKKTLLYIVGCEPHDVPPMPLKLGEATHVIAMCKAPGRGTGGQRLRKGMPGWRPEVSKAEREHTPPDLALWLVALAKTCHHNFRNKSGCNNKSGSS